MEVVLINLGVVIFFVLAYIFWNLLRKVEKLESIIEIQEKYLFYYRAYHILARAGFRLPSNMSVLMHLVLEMTLIIFYFFSLSLLDN